MAPATLDHLLTTADLIAMPDDGMERWIIDGELREKPMTKRNRFHSRIMANLSYLLKEWLVRQPTPRGEALCGEAGVTLRHNPDSSVGIDVVYLSPEVVAKQSDDTTMIDGVPTLVIEILSPNDTQEEIHEKTDKYLEVGVPHVWIVDPHDETVRVHRPNELPVLFNAKQSVDAEPHLAGFKVAVARIFE